MSWWERRAEAFARTKPGGWFAINIANPIDRRLLRWTRGRVDLFLGQPVGLLETVGARSGQPRDPPALRGGERPDRPDRLQGGRRAPPGLVPQPRRASRGGVHWPRRAARAVSRPGGGWRRARCAVGAGE